MKRVYFRYEHHHSFFNGFPKEVSHLKEREGCNPVSRWEMNVGWR
ncbi:Uncharacterised protein [[Flavobacterium] thermophilum]|nr:hypothetical protein GARCT_00710 [Geobacillus sp. 12AMOR1]STO36312.1 Uncharacterised protein [[Flavobacterium] thermophilum]